MIEEFSGFFRRIKQDNDQLNLIVPGAQVFAGISGGVDSVVLLHYLCWLRERQSLDLTVVHFDHGLRTESKAEAKFVERLTSNYGIPYVCCEIDVQTIAAERGKGIEEAARYLRRQYWQSLVSQNPNCLIATGHHRDDLAETMLINLTRGTGLSGLTSLAWRRDHYVRPLLAVSREEIKRFAESEQLEWVEDMSNQSADYLRNRIRHQLLPLWEDIAGFDVRKKLAQLSQFLADDRAYLTEQAAELLAKIMTDDLAIIKIELLREASPSLRRRTLELYFQKLGIADINSKQFEVISDIIVKNSRARFCNLPHGLIFERRKQKMILRGYHGAKS